MENGCMTVSVVNFHAVWGQKRENLCTITGYLEAAARQGSAWVVFPELALSGFRRDASREDMEALSETLSGPAVVHLAKQVQRLGIFTTFGLPQRREGKLYNSLVTCGPDGFLSCYDKLHRSAADMAWAAPGEALPLVLEMPAGRMMVISAYECLYFLELCRYAKAKGVSLLAGAGALDEVGMGRAYQTMLMRRVGLNTLPVALANLTGECLGGSQILCPAEPIEQAYVAAGCAFYEADAKFPGLFTETLDLSMDEIMPHYPYFEHNPRVGAPDWRPERYLLEYDNILRNSAWCAAQDGERMKKQ